MSLEKKLSPNSERCSQLAAELNNAKVQGNATCTVDLFAGGFAFSDEIPAGFGVQSEMLSGMLALLRYLWCYRTSLIEGKPRTELLPYWELAKRVAPNWAGFSVDRVSNKMLDKVKLVRAGTSKFLDDIEALEARIYSSKTKGSQT